MFPISGFQLMLFLAKLNGDPVAITAGGLVPITKPLIVTVILSLFQTFHCKKNSQVNNDLKETKGLKEG